MVEGRDRVLAPVCQGTPRAPHRKEGMAKWRPESKEGARMELHGAAWRWAVGTRGCDVRQGVAPLVGVRDRQLAPIC